MGISKLPNIVIIVCDTLGAKHMSLYGYQRRTTPNLERLVEIDNFTPFTRCFSPAPWTVPAHASLLTGLYPSEHNCDGSNIFLDQQFYTLPELLQTLEYKTIGISSNALVSTLFGYGKGFDEFHETWNIFEEGQSEKDIVINFLHKKDTEKIKFLFKSLRHFNLKPLVKVAINGANKKLRSVSNNSLHSTIKSLKICESVFTQHQDSTKPFFLFVNLMQTHDKYNPPQKFRNNFVKYNGLLERRHHRESEYVHYAEKPFEEEYLEYMKGLYDEEILCLDNMLNELYEKLKTSGVHNNTFFIITSDHGELFGEHGHIHHLFTTYNELIHIPLIVRYPEVFGKDAINSNIVQLHDIFSTIMDLTDAPYPKPESSVSFIDSTDKRSFAVSQLLDVGFKIDACIERNPQFDITNFPYRNTEISIIGDNMRKLTKRTNGFEGFYDLNNDFNEMNNLINKEEASSISELEEISDIFYPAEHG